ncbi:MAG: NAD-binding protein, partial [Planctomycetaceae bacterium]|nr:NAD-binding protein [Planctomycetaceae bacterium]
VGLGMGIPAPDGMNVIVLALVLGAISIAARYVIFFPLFYYTGLDRRNSMVASTKLAQVSEFCLVIAYLGLSFEHIDKGFVSSVIFAFVITALACPFIFNLGDAMHDKLGPLLSKLGFKVPETVKHEGSDETYELALLGVHRVASSLLEEMRREQPELLKKVLVVDFNVGIHSKIAQLGPTVKYGDLSNPETLHHAGVEKAKVIVCTITDDLLKGTTNRKLVKALRHIAPHSKIIANAVTFEETRHLYEAGADYVYHDRVKTAQILLPAITHAVNGDLASYREQREKVTGHWHERAEIIP